MSEMRRQIGTIVRYASYYFVPTGLAFLGVLLDRWVAWMPAAVILAYAAWASHAYKGTPARLMFAGEQIYFLGYLCTIVAFFALAFRLRNGVAPEDLRPAVLLVGCVALSTTIAGLLGMAVLREVAKYTEGLDGGYAPEVRVTVDLPVEAASSLQELRAAAEQTGRTIEELGDRLKETSLSASGLGTALTESGSGMRSFSEEADQGRQTLTDYTLLVKQKFDLEKETSSSLTNLQSAYADAAKAVRTLMQSFHSLGKLCAAAGQTGLAIEVFVNHLEGITRSASGLGKTLAEAESGVRSMSEEANQSRQALANYALAVRQKSELENESCSRLAHLRSAYSAAAKTVGELEEMSQALRGTLEYSNSELKKGNAALNVFAKAAPQIKGSLEDFVDLLDRKLIENMDGFSRGRK